MLGRLAKMRIVGLQYDSTKIHSENLNLDFTVPEGEPGHGAYILRNAGGKGVFLQSLIQTMEPGASWKKDKNKVTQFFYNEEKKPVNYTFHIVQEWYISPVKSVVLGVSIAPKFSSFGKDSGEGSALAIEYITYVKELTPTNKFDLFKDLNLWKEENKEAISIDTLKEILKVDSTYTVYPMIDIESYKEKISEYGITEATVSIIKQINVSEGDFGSFFDGATDNMGLFYKLLVPTINDKLEGIDSRNKDEISSLSASFLDTLKISKELPDLLAMVDNIEQINDIILPLKDRFLEGEEIQTKQEKWEGKGLEILKFLEVLEDQKGENLKKINEEIDLKSKELHLTKWKFRNIDYIELRQERDELDGVYFEKEHEQKIKDLSLKDVKKRLLESQVNLELMKREGLLDEIEKRNHNISVLLQSENSQATVKSIDDIKAYFTERWNDIFSFWQRELDRYHSSLNAHETKLNDLGKSIKEEEEELKTNEYDIRDLDRTIKAHAKKVEEANESYGVEVKYLVKEVLSEIKKQREKITSSLHQGCQQLTDIEKELLRLNVEIEKRKTLVERVTDDIDEANEKIKESSGQEKEVVSKVSHILKEKYEGDLERTEAIEIKNKLLLHLQSLKEKQKGELLSKWQVNEDVHLIEEGNEIGCFIPNKDLLRVKALLDEHKISSMYGTEFLSKLSAEEMRLELEQNPVIRYSIVVLEDKFESLNLSFVEKELIRSNVVLIDRTQTSKKTKHKTTNPSLSKLDEVNFTLNEKSYLFVEDDYEYELWKANIEKVADDIEIELDATNKNIKEVENLIQRIESLIQSKLKVEWSETLLKLEQQKVNLLTEISNFEIDLSNKENDKVLCKEKIEVIERELKECKEREDELFTLEKEIEQNKINVQKKNKLEEVLEYRKHVLDELVKEKEQLQVQMHNNKSSFDSWFDFVKRNYSVLKRMLDDVRLPVPNETLSSSEEKDLRPQTFKYSLKKEDLNLLVSYKELESDLSNRNSRIADMRAEIKGLNEKLLLQEEELNQLYGNGWGELHAPEEDVLHLKNQVTILETESSEIQRELQTIQEDMKFNQRQIENLDNKINDKKVELEKDFPDEGAQYEEILDCKETRELYRQKRNVLTTEIQEVNLEISKLKKLIEDVERTITLLRTLEIKEKYKIKQLTEEEKLKIGDIPMEYYTEWNAEYNRIDKQNRDYNDTLKKRVNQMKDKIESFQHLPERYKFELLNFLATIRDIGYQEAVMCLDNYLDWARDNLQDEMAQKEKADMAVNLWVERSSRRVLQIVGALQHLTSKMTVVNWTGERFPLIKYTKNFPFPTELEDVCGRVKEFCLNEVDRYVKKTKKNVDELTVRDVAKTVNVSNIVLQALGDFPRLLIHIPGMEGELLRGESKYAYYEDWEVINNGSASSATKSGGQTLMARMIVIAMLMRERVDDNSPLFLVTDNPFGTMSANELIESTFSLLDLLRIQWLVVAPPIANVQITSKFHTVYNMSIEVVEGTKVLNKKLMKNHRRFLNDISVLNNPHEKRA